MLRNYLKIARRNIWKSRGLSIINIFGLAVGIAAVFFIFQYVYFESTYDRFHTQYENIYRVPISFSGGGTNKPSMAVNHPAVGPAMKAEFPEVVDFIRLAPVSLFMPAYTLAYRDVRGNEKVYAEDGMYLADASFFKIFSYPLVAGDRENCLKQPNSIVISASIAKKYFGDANPLGKTLDMNGSMLETVTGVFEDVPDNSHIKFDMLVSFSSIKADYGYDDWDRPEFYNYVLLAPGTDVKEMEAKLPGFVEKYLGAGIKSSNIKTSFSLQAITDIHLRSNYQKEAEANGSEREIYFLSVIGVFILFIAWINYINLSTAKSIERAKEVGLRKVIGAEKSQLIIQFLFESLIINSLALVVAVGIILCCTPFFNDFVGKNVITGVFAVGLGLKPVFWLAVIAIFLLGTLLVGVYPAFVLSSFIPVSVLKGLKVQTRGLSVRQFLVSVQFVLSIILIASTIVVFKQFRFMRTEDLGYNKDQLLVIKTPVVKGEMFFNEFNFFKDEVLKVSSIKDATGTTAVPGYEIDLRGSLRREGQNRSQSVVTHFMEIDEHFIPTYEMEILAGNNFTSIDKGDTDNSNNVKVLVNEEAVKALGYTSVVEAVNQNIVWLRGDSTVYCTVGGVLKNFHQRSLKEKFEPILFYYPKMSDWRFMSVKLPAENQAKGLSGLEKLYRKTFPGSPFEYFFLDDYFDQQYKADERVGDVLGVFAVLAIVVACLGLLGLSSFVVKLKTKEIGVRKVLGASLVSLLLLVSREFVKILCIASVISLPVVYYLSNNWLTQYAFHVTPDLLIFIGPPALLVILTLIIVCAQSFKTALMNPVKSLSSE